MIPPARLAILAILAGIIAGGVQAKQKTLFEFLTDEPAAPAPAAKPMDQAEQVGVVLSATSICGVLWTSRYQDAWGETMYDHEQRLRRDDARDATLKRWGGKRSPAQDQWCRAIWRDYGPGSALRWLGRN